MKKDENLILILALSYFSFDRTGNRSNYRYSGENILLLL